MASAPHLRSDDTNGSEDAGAAVLEQFEDLIEAALAAVIRVWHAGLAVRAAIPHQRPDFRVKATLGVQRADLGEIVLIHGDDQVEGLEVVYPDLAGAAGDVVTVAFQGCRHA